MTEIAVAVAVILNSENQVLTSWRTAAQHQGNLWEFPGGKCEHNETVFDALKRELDEELSIELLQAEPFTQIAHDYGDKKVVLHVWQVFDYQGVPVGNEGQQLRWQKVSELDARDFPVANLPIIEALQQG